MAPNLTVLHAYCKLRKEKKRKPPRNQSSATMLSFRGKQDTFVSPGKRLEPQRAKVRKLSLADLVFLGAKEASGRKLPHVVIDLRPSHLFLTSSAHRWLGQRSCRTKVPRIFRILVPNFLPKNFPRVFRGSFVLCFPGDGDHKKFTKNPLPFSIPNPQANTKTIHKVFLESRQSNRWWTSVLEAAMFSMMRPERDHKQRIANSGFCGEASIRWVAVLMMSHGSGSVPSTVSNRSSFALFGGGL